MGFRFSTVFDFVWVVLAYGVVLAGVGFDFVEVVPADEGFADTALAVHTVVGLDIVGVVPAGLGFADTALAVHTVVELDIA